MSHLIDALQEHYEISIDYTGSLYCGIILFWNYKEGYLEISMPGYVKKKLLKYKQLPPQHQQDRPLAPAPRSFEKNSQRPPPPPPGIRLSSHGRNLICCTRPVDIEYNIPT